MVKTEKKDLRGLVKKIKACRKCSLPEGSYPVFSPVFSAKIILIGQAPGKEEIEKGTPFIGKAGRRLFDWLEKVGIKEGDFRKKVYITQVMKCFPGKGKRGDLKPKGEHLVNCLPYLRDEIKKLDPKVLIPVGSLAINNILGRRRLKEVVGKIFKIDLLGKKRFVIPLPHPSGLSVWSFKRENLLRIEKAVKILSKYFSSPEAKDRINLS
ncbi:MAG: uracil-DNA glycosylase family protein [candidate division WOR-3 bacterium]